MGVMATGATRRDAFERADAERSSSPVGWFEEFERLAFTGPGAGVEAAAELVAAVSRDEVRLVDQERLAGALRSVIRSRPTDARLHLLAAGASWWRGDLAGAHDALETAIRLAEPDTALAHECEVESLFNRARQRLVSADEAMAELRRLRGEAREPYVHVRADETEVAVLGQSPRLDEVERAARLAGDVVVDYQRLGLPSAAAACARSAVAAAHQHLGAHHDGLALLERAHPDLDGLPADHRAGFHGLHGRIAWLGGRPDRARASAEATLAIPERSSWMGGYAHWTLMNLAGAEAGVDAVRAAYHAARSGLGAMMSTSTGLVVLGEAAVAHARVGLAGEAADLLVEARSRRDENDLEFRVAEAHHAIVGGAPGAAEVTRLLADRTLPWRRRESLRALLRTVEAPTAAPGSAGTTPSLRVEVFDGFRVRRDGRTVEVPTGVVERLVACLVIDGPTTPDALVERLWPDDPKASRLKNVVYRARRSLGAEAIVHDGAHTRLADHVTSDLAEFVEALGEGPLDAAGLRRCYPGPLLPHLDEIEWEFTRERTARRFAWAIRQSLDAGAIPASTALEVTEDRSIDDEALLVAIARSAMASGDTVTADGAVARVAGIRAELGLPVEIDLS